MKSIKGINKTYKIDQSDCFWNMICRTEDYIRKLAPDDIQNNRGVYIFWNWEDQPIRVGKAVKARNRILSYQTNAINYYVFSRMEQEIAYVSVIYTNDELESRKLELELLKRHRPKYNYQDIE